VPDKTGEVKLIQPTPGGKGLDVSSGIGFFILFRNVMHNVRLQKYFSGMLFNTQKCRKFSCFEYGTGNHGPFHAGFELDPRTGWIEDASRYNQAPNLGSHNPRLILRAVKPAEHTARKDDTSSLPQMNRNAAVAFEIAAIETEHRIRMISQHRFQVIQKRTA
jgi:hypothetical protein